MKWNLEMTDTFGGEANYCWVERKTIDCKAQSLYSKVAAAKRAMGLRGRCKVEDYGDMLTIRPNGMNVVLFMGWDESQEGAE
jgi:hypothetical protein